MSVRTRLRKINRAIMDAERPASVGACVLGAWICGMLFVFYPVASMLGAFVAAVVAIVIVEENP